jgi:hypothetical protein
MSAGSLLYVSASVVLTCAFLGVGVSFFGPFWMSNVAAAVNETTEYPGYLHEGNDPADYPDRGLWAQCGKQCKWFWDYERDYRLQKKLFTPLKWHLATQILYFIGAAIILFCEIINRVHACCCYRHTGMLFALGIAIFVSALVQTAAVAAFGAGASRDPYNAETNPKHFSKYLGQAFGLGEGYEKPYLSWCYWTAVVGDMLSVVSGVLFMIAACCGKEQKEDRY